MRFQNFLMHYNRFRKAQGEFYKFLQIFTFKAKSKKSETSNQEFEI